VGQSQTQTASRRDPSLSASPALPHCVFLETAQVSSWLKTHHVNPLAIVSFGSPVPDTFPSPVIHLNLPELAGPSRLEVWSTTDQVRAYRDEGFSASASGNVLFGTVTMDEQSGQPIEIVTERAYRRLFSCLQDLPYHHIWRIWNYFPDINGFADGLERYQGFCLGRHRALADMLPGFPHSLPAGTAVGTRSGPLQIYFIAGTLPATHLGNPRQVHAYEYPQDYGPQSPSFARATLSRSETHSQLYIAGTASVVGHTSQHVGLPKEQTLETIQNLRALLAHAEDVAHRHFTGPQSAVLYKVYVRDAAHLSEVREALRSIPLSSKQVLFLQGELCRKELLVEIEGLITSD